VLRNRIKGDALYIAWKLKDVDASTAREVQARLTGGEGRKLYRLQSWVILDGEVQALLQPASPLEEITGAIWGEGMSPLRSRWIAGTRACAEAAREIETAPVLRGLALRPEQWPYSSAALE
jgi:hypothetical protein